MFMTLNLKNPPDIGRLRPHSATALELALLAEAFIMNLYFLPARSAARPGRGYCF